MKLLCCCLRSPFAAKARTPRPPALGMARLGLRFLSLYIPQVPGPTCSPPPPPPSPSPPALTPCLSQTALPDCPTAPARTESLSLLVLSHCGDLPACSNGRHLREPPSHGRLHWFDGRTTQHYLIPSLPTRTTTWLNPVSTATRHTSEGECLLRRSVIACCLRRSTRILTRWRF